MERYYDADWDVVVDRDGETVLCEWYGLCENPATHFKPHPTLKWVPCCLRCARITDVHIRK